MIAAIAAGLTAGIVDVMPVIRPANRIVRADLQAGSAMGAKGFDKTRLGFYRDALGIRAPLAG